MILRAQGAKLRGYTWKAPLRAPLLETLTPTLVITPSVRAISPILGCGERTIDHCDGPVYFVCWGRG